MSGAATTDPSALTVAPLDLATWPVFADLVEANGGVFGGCWCVGMHPKDPSGQASTPARNRARKLQLVRDGSAHAALVMEAGACVGWVQFGTVDEVPRIKNRVAWERSTTDPPDWRIACCYVGKGHRRAGVFATGLAGAVDLVAGMGGGVVEGYPEPSGTVAAGFLFHGALSTYEALGFHKDRRIGAHRWVVRRHVAPT